MKVYANIGAIDISQNAVRIVIVRTGITLPHVIDAVEVPIVQSETIEKREAQVAAVREALDRVASNPAAYVLTVPSAWSVFRLVKVPFRGHKKVAHAAPAELEHSLAIPMEKLAVDFVKTREIGKETEVLSVGVRRDAINEKAALIREAGVRIQGAMLDTLSMTSLWLALRKGGPRISGILHIREEECTLAIVEDKHLRSLHRLSATARDIQIDPMRVVHDVQNIFRTFASETGGGEDVESLHITGVNLEDASNLVFDSEFDIPVSYDGLASRIDGFDDAPFEISSLTTGRYADENNQWSAPLAAAMAAGGAVISMDFLQQHFTLAGALRNLTKHTLAAAALAAMIVTAFLGLAYADYSNKQLDIDEIGTAIWDEFSTTYPDLALERPRNDTGGIQSSSLMLQAADEERASTRTVSLQMFNNPSLLDLLAEISEILPNRVVAISEIAIGGTGTREIVITGEVKNPEKFQRALQLLETSEYISFKSDRLQRTSVGGKETFVITGTL